LQYSPSLKKLFVKMNAVNVIYFKFSTRNPTDCVIRASPVFEQAADQKDVVRRCTSHQFVDEGTKLLFLLMKFAPYYAERIAKNGINFSSRYA